jgi:hypothetical protein
LIRSAVTTVLTTEIETVEAAEEITSLDTIDEITDGLRIFSYERE